nr:hypothetical protein [Tanacetum cinerariifolium]
SKCENKGTVPTEMELILKQVQQDKKNLALHTQGKKKANPIVIPSIRFAKLIIRHLRSKHKFHPRPDSLLHLPYEEYILGYLKFSAKRTKREVFRMPIPNELITADIQGEQYYNEYLENVAKHQRYLVSKEGSDPDSLTPKLAKATKKSKPSAPKAAPVTKPAAAKAFESTSSQQPKPKHEPAKTQEKKHKLVTKTSDELSPAKHSKPSLVTKRRKPTSSLRLVDEFVDEGIPEREPRFDDEEADMKKAVEESLKSVHDAHRGPLLSMVALDLLTLQTPKKVSPAKQYIFQRRTPAPTEPSGHAESPSIYAELGLTNSDIEFDEEVPPVVKVGAQDEGQAGPNPGPKQMDEGFTATAYPNVQKNLKLTIDEQLFGDQFFNDKPSKAEIEKTTVETEAESMVDLPEADIKKILHQWMWETHSYKAHKDHMMLYKALEKSPPYQPPPPLPPAGPSRTLGSPGASGSSQFPPPYSLPSTSQSYQLGSSVSSIPEDLRTDDDTAPDEQVHSSDDEDIRNAHIPNVNLQQDWWKPLGKDRPATPEPAWSIPSSDLHIPTSNWASALASTYTPPPVNSLLAHTGDMAIFMVWFYKKQGITELKPQDLEGPAFEIVKVFHPNVIHLQYQMEECHKLLTDSIDKSIIGYNVSKPLPLGGPPSQVTVQSDFFFNKDLEYLRYGSKGGRLALSILKMKAAYYLDVGLEQMVPDQMWIEKECKYDIAVVYGISHWCQLIDQTLGYQTTRRRPPAEDRKLPDSTQPHQTLMGYHCFEYKHDFTIIDSPRAVTFRDKYGV